MLFTVQNAIESTLGQEIAMIEFITAIEFNGAKQDSSDPEVMSAKNEVYEAIARAEIPTSPMNSALHILHKNEKIVQAYLRQHNMQAP
jgi:hypothetical protein